VSPNAWTVYVAADATAGAISATATATTIGPARRQADRENGVIINNPRFRGYGYRFLAR
jgi:hypothetical protein